AAADYDFTKGVHDIAVAVADAVVFRDGGILAQHDVVAADEINVVFHGAGDVVGTDVHEVADQPFRPNVIKVRRKNDLRALQREDARRLHVAAVGADDDAELDAAALEHRELATLPVKRLIREALAVGSEDMPLLRDDGRVIKVAAAQLVEADDQRRVESPGAV